MIRIRRDVVESQNIAQITVQPELRLSLQVRVHFLCHGIIRKFYPARFVEIECFDECVGAVVIAVVEVYVMHAFLHVPQPLWSFERCTNRAGNVSR